MPSKKTVSQKTVSQKTVSQKKAVVLVSGGLDSTTVLAIARSESYACYTLSFDYGQRHNVELQAAERIAQAMGSLDHKVIQLDLRTIGGSALTDSTIAVPEHETAGVPVTYVPARNTVFLSIALGWAEVLGAEDIFIGVNAVDFSGYPDCRPDYIAAFEVMANLATRVGAEGGKLRIRTPLIDLSKGEIIQRGLALQVDYGATVSCYQANHKGEACGKCDSCRLRRAGFVQAGVADPTHYCQ
jgi:7-cyano-7-deazaguanine synthase